MRAAVPGEALRRVSPRYELVHRSGEQLLLFERGQADRIPPGSSVVQTVYKDGMLCATLEALGATGYTFHDANGNLLGTLVISATSPARTITCPGEAPITLPTNCPSVPCTAGTCS